MKPFVLDGDFEEIYRLGRGVRGERPCALECALIWMTRKDEKKVKAVESTHKKIQNKIRVLF